MDVRPPDSAFPLLSTPGDGDQRFFPSDVDLNHVEISLSVRSERPEAPAEFTEAPTTAIQTSIRSGIAQETITENDWRMDSRLKPLPVHHDRHRSLPGENEVRINGQTRSTESNSVPSSFSSGVQPRVSSAGGDLRKTVLAEKKELLNLEFEGSDDEEDFLADAGSSSQDEETAFISTLLQPSGKKCVHCETVRSRLRASTPTQPERTVVRAARYVYEELHRALRPKRFSCRFVSSLYAQFFTRQRHLWLQTLCVLFLLKSVAEMIIALTRPSSSFSEILLFAGMTCGLTVLTVVTRVEKTWKYTNLISGAVWSIILFEIIYMLFLSAEPQDVTTGMWQAILSLFSFYAFLPLPWTAAALVGIVFSLLAVSGMLVAADIGRQHMWEVAAANMLILLAVNFIGIALRYVLAKQDENGFRQTSHVVEVTTRSNLQADLERGLLRSMLPDHVFQDMKKALEEGERSVSGFHPVSLKRYEPVSILFADIKGFTKMSGTMDASELVTMLNGLFARFDDLAEENGCLRIKLLGDCYFAVSGVPEACEDHADRCVNLGLRMVAEIGRNHLARRHNLGMRIGVHSGGVLSGVLGRHKWQYDVWSQDVVLANHIESGGIAGRIHISEETQRHLVYEYDFQPGNGADRDDYLKQHQVKTFFVQLAADNRYKVPNPPSPPAVTTLDAQRALTIPLSGFTERSYRIRQGDQPEDTSSSLIAARLRDDLATTVLSRYDNKIQQENLSNVKLLFRNDKWGNRYNRTSDPSFNVAMMTFLPVSVFCAISLLLTYPRHSSAIAVYSFLVFTTFIISCLVALSYVPKTALIREHRLMRKLLSMSAELMSRRGLRMLCSLHCTNVPYIMAAISMHTCGHTGYTFCSGNDTSPTKNCTRVDMIVDNLDPQSEQCFYPQFFVFVFMINILAHSMLIRTKLFQKFIFFVLTLPITMGLALASYAKYFRSHQELVDAVVQARHDEETHYPVGVIAVAGLAMPFIIMVGLIHSRRIEIKLKLDFVWKRLACHKLNEANYKRRHCLRLLHNLMPENVARHFLLYRWPTIYHNSHNECGVLFASLQGFSDFYNEKDHNSQGVECLRLLNEIWHDFDGIVSKEEYCSDVDKIKMIGSIYMAASGLHGNSGKEALVKLTLVALDMITAIENINSHAYQDFQLRVGINVGPLVSGVIGAKKPLFDIWGDTVNLASRMESTGISNKIQVTVAAYNMLKDRFVMTKRANVFVKGKGELTTYLIKGQVKETAL